MDSKFGTAANGTIDRVSEPAYLEVPAGHLPGPAKPLIGPLAWLLPTIFVNGTQRIDFKGSTTSGSPTIAKVTTASPLTTFAAGAAVSGPGIPSGARVVVFDAASGNLTIDRAASATAQDASLATDTPEAGVKVGPFPTGTPLSLVLGMELAPETGGLIPTILHDMGLAWKIGSLPWTLRTISTEKDAAKRESMANDLQSRLYAENKCPDLVVNRGHYFGTSKFGEEPGLSDADKEALIAFLKTF